MFRSQEHLCAPVIFLQEAAKFNLFLLQFLFGFARFSFVISHRNFATEALARPFSEVVYSAVILLNLFAVRGHTIRCWASFLARATWDHVTGSTSFLFETFLQINRESTFVFEGACTLHVDSVDSFVSVN